MEKPLHVRVAEVLGWVWMVHTDDSRSVHPGQRFLVSPVDAENLERLKHSKKANGTEPLAVVDASEVPRGESTLVAYSSVPRYDTSWEATGPLIEKYVTIPCDHTSSGVGWLAGKTVPDTSEEADDGGLFYGDHESTALRAVCSLILALKAAGKL